VESLIKALTTYGTDKLTEDQAQELVSQVSVAAGLTAGVLQILIDS
jgi:hypothetical protein